MQTRLACLCSQMQRLKACSTTSAFFKKLAPPSFLFGDLFYSFRSWDYRPDNSGNLSFFKIAFVSTYGSSFPSLVLVNFFFSCDHYFAIYSGWP